MSSNAPKQRLVVVGASGRSAAQRAALCGMNVLAIDQFGDRDLKAFAKVRELNAIFDFEDSFWEPWRKSPVMLCGGMENRQDQVDLLLRRGLVCGVSSEMLCALRSLESWAQWAAWAGILWPGSHGPGNEPENARADDREKSPWLVKSRLSAGGLGVRRWRGETLGPMEYVQRHVTGEVLGVTFLNRNNHTTVVGCMKSWTDESFMGPTPFLYRGNVGPIPLEVVERNRLAKFGNCIREATGLKGIWQADFVRDPRGWWLLEINPRWSGSMELLEVTHGISLVQQHVAAVLNSEYQSPVLDWEQLELRSREPSSTRIGKVVRYASAELSPSPTTLDRWWGYRWDGTLDSLSSTNRLADIPGVATTIPGGFPICTEYAAGNSVDEIRHRLRSSVITGDISPGPAS